jgi:hypothetical protein
MRSIRALTAQTGRPPRRLTIEARSSLFRLSSRATVRPSACAWSSPVYGLHVRPLRTAARARVGQSRQTKSTMPDLRFAGAAPCAGPRLFADRAQASRRSERSSTICAFDTALQSQMRVVSGIWSTAWRARHRWRKQEIRALRGTGERSRIAARPAEPRWPLR